MSKIKIDIKKITKEYKENFLEVIDDVILDYLAFEKDVKTADGLAVLNDLTAQDYIEILNALLEEIKKST